MLELNFTISKNNEKTRLDKLLKKYHPEFTRLEIKKAIISGVVKVNGYEVKPSRCLKLGDKITGLLKKLSDIYLRPNDSILIELLYEDSDIIAINKYPGYSVYPSKHHQYNTVANGLLVKFPYLKKEFYGSIRLGIIHRLDKETSGVLLVAKNRDSFYNISKLFEKRLIRKTYLALVCGNLISKEGRIDAALARSFKDIRKRLVVSMKDLKGMNIQKAKQALTDYKVLQSFKKFDLVEVHPQTGRMHQLRAHFLYIGHPILGDRLYSDDKFKSALVVPRLMLHANQVEFTYKNKYYKIEAPLPEDFKNMISNARL